MLSRFYCEFYMEHTCCISKYQSLGRFVPRRRSWQTAQRTWQTWNQTKVSNVLKWYWPNFIEDITKMIATLRTHMKLVVTRRNGFATSARLFKLLNACRRVTPVVCCSLRDICEELRGAGRSWEGEELGGTELERENYRANLVRASWATSSSTFVKTKA